MKKIIGPIIYALCMISFTTTINATPNLVVVEVQHDQVSSTETIHAISVNRSDGQFGYKITLADGKMIEKKPVVTATEPVKYEIKYIASCNTPAGDFVHIVISQCGGEVWACTHKNNGQEANFYYTQGVLGKCKQLGENLAYWPISRTDLQTGICYKAGDETINQDIIVVPALINTAH